jgi:hypothetical protein
MTSWPGTTPLIVNGMPGAGKSTIAGLLAARLPRAAFVSGDTVASMIRGGRVWALGEPADEAARQVQLTLRGLALLADSFSAAGFVPVIEGVIPDRAQLDTLVGLLATPPLHVVLAPGIDACRSRNATRDETERWEFDGYEGLQASMRDGFGEAGWWFDTAGLTVEETVERVLREAPERGRV